VNRLTKTFRIGRKIEFAVAHLRCTVCANSFVAENAGKTLHGVSSSDGKCLHYYFYFVDEEPGFRHVRVPTWVPCRLQICLNGHNWLAGRLRQAGIEYRIADNAFTHIGDRQKVSKKSLMAFGGAGNLLLVWY
jgi:hypothetical protein